jgi:hypothetical protein
MPTETERDSKIVRLCELINASDDSQTDLDKLVALSMKTGYELGKQTQNA